jgi:N6-adenosine-specific RNA methylase IME4
MQFNVIYADPAWHYNDKALAGDRGAGCKYPLLKDKDLYALPVESIAAPDCALFMWATMPKLAEALQCGKSWGFEYKTNAFTWVKRNRTGTPWFFGMGRWTRANAELCLLFTRGKPKRLNAGVCSVIDTVRARHSAKPAETRDRIVRLVGDLPRVELFAREQTPGWVSLGFDIDGRDMRESIPALAAQGVE